MHHARATLNKIFAQTLRREGGNDAPVLAWPLACGGKVAEKTTAFSYRDGVLAVEVPDAMWRNQLQTLTRQYVAALNQISPRKVQSISFVLPGRHAATPRQ